MTTLNSRQILDFWFKETPPERWFSADPAFDERVRLLALDTWKAAKNGAFRDWASTSEGALALIILLDQFPRNMFRGTADSFATDALARDIAKHAIARGLDLETPASIRNFFYLPLQHSESNDDQERCVQLLRERLGTQHTEYSFALRHRDVIARFGRFPARNAALGRTSTPEETVFLQSNPIGF